MAKKRKAKQVLNHVEIQNINTYTTKYKQHISEGTVGNHTIHRSGGTAKASLVKLQRAFNQTYGA